MWYARKRDALDEKHGIDHATVEQVSDAPVAAADGRSGVRRALLGSVTERTLRSTDAPVLVVDAQQDR